MDESVAFYWKHDSVVLPLDFIFKKTCFYLKVAEWRKRYGLSFDERCKNYRIVFQCMTTCKSIGYQVYRINFRCKCVCHKFKTTTELPFYVWRTNGTTRKIPQTFRPQLYHIVGTLSPKRVHKITTEATNDTTETSTEGNGTDKTNTDNNGTTEGTTDKDKTDVTETKSGDKTGATTSSDNVDTTPTAAPTAG